MNILYIFNRGEIGGATKAMLNTISGLKNTNINPIIISPNKNGFVSKYCLDNNIDFIYIKYFELGYAFNDFNFKKLIKLVLLPILFLLNRLFNYIGNKKISKIVDFKKVLCIHTNTNRDDFGLYIAKKNNIKHVLHLREFDTDFFKLKYLKNNVYNYFNKNTDIFIAVSEALKQYYSNKGIESDKIEVVYDGIDVKNIQKKKLVEHDRFKIVMLSNITENKGQIQLIEAINLLDEDIKKMVLVDFYGTGSADYILYLKKIVYKYNLNNQIKFLGYQKNVYDVLKKYDIGITASKIEGFGLVTIEYMAAGLCTIVSDTGANTEIIDDNINGLVYHYNDCNDLKEKILLIINNESLSKKIVNNAKIKIKKYSKEENVKKIERIYREIEKNENK